MTKLHSGLNVVVPGASGCSTCSPCSQNIDRSTLPYGIYVFTSGHWANARLTHTGISTAEIRYLLPRYVWELRMLI
ncbi:hypothetical protein B0H16DRAFT_1703663 [Mycena metata]|uniref:Uncharacterized protein n=1 Tax=Mycena metata TaxID=1033252 RepID=A0AAD7H1Q3_9AGAR|nr:hypothetical protein B0H16DRAFT_1703663 [Mycena metata]